jgi:hypothetical protein
MPSAFAHARAEGLRSRQVNHRYTNRLMMRDSSMLRHGRGRRPVARAFARFRIEDSYEGMRPSLPLGLAELPAFLRHPLDGSKGLSRTRRNRWQIIFLVFRATLRALL